MSFDAKYLFSACILIAPGWDNPHIEGMNQIQRDFLTGRPTICFHNERESLVFFLCYPAKRNNFCKVWI